jgi:hypothetical protein
MFDLMNNEGLPVNFKQYAPIADPQAIVGDEGFEAFHIAGKAVAHSLNLVDDSPRNIRRHAFKRRDGIVQINYFVFHRLPWDGSGILFRATHYGALGR